MSSLGSTRFHGLTTQGPDEVWLTIDVKPRKPKADGLLQQIVLFSGDSLSSRIEEHLVQGVAIKVYNPAKTVTDCFMYRNKIGLDVELEALRECWRERSCTVDDLWHYDNLCQVANVMRPYLKSLP